MTSPDDLIRRGDALSGLPEWAEAARLIWDLPAAPLPDDVVRYLRLRVAAAHDDAADALIDRYGSPTCPDPEPVPWVPSVGDRVDVADDALNVGNGRSRAAGLKGAVVTLVHPHCDPPLATVTDPARSRTGTPRISDLSPASPACDERPVDPEWTELRQLVTWIDNDLDGEVAEQYRDQPLAQDWARVAKVSEEAGEAIDALIGLTGQNPRKGSYGNLTDLLNELADVALTGLYAIQHFTKDREETFDTLMRRGRYHRQRRVDQGADRGMP